MWKHTVAATLCVQEQAIARALSTNTQKIFSSLAGWLLGTCVHPHSREKMVAQQPQKIQPPVYATERALKRLVFGNTSDGLIHHHQKHPIWFVCVTLLLRHTVAVIRGYDQNNSQWLNMPRCALHKIERRCCFRIAERRSKAYEQFFGGSLSGVREKDSKQQVDTLTRHTYSEIQPRDLLTTTRHIQFDLDVWLCFCSTMVMIHTHDYNNFGWLVMPKCAHEI